MGKYLGPLIENVKIKKMLFQFNVPVEDGGAVIGYNHNVVFLFKLIDDEGREHEQNEKQTLHVSNDEFSSLQIINGICSNTFETKLKNAVKAALLKYADTTDPDLE